MSPGGETVRIPYGCFPRVSGDEPSAQAHYRRFKEFSPRERG